MPVYLLTASPEFMMLEEVWNIAQQDLLVLKHYSSFTDFRQKISLYFRTKRFGLNMRLFAKDGLRTYMKWYRTENFDDYFPGRMKNCKLKHVRNWLRLFVDYHNKEIKPVK
jgi:hypothetical protein